MCAIIGVLGKNLPSQEQFIKARDTMTHRGPDDAGMYYKPEEGIALGHRRLSIIDLSPEGRQPFFSYDKRYAIVFNGEIYNYKELKDELKNKYPFKTKTDTEVLLAAYIQWGEKCLQKFNGMFAFAIWDRNKKELFCARDRLGVKPFYYSVYNNNFYFSSEIKGILTMAEIERKLNKESFSDFLSYRYPLGSKTMFEGISSLLPGYCMKLKEKKTSVFKKYWELPVVVNKKDPGESNAINETKKLLMESVRYRMMSDVPVGTYLSGGLDSSLITALMASLSSTPVKTFSVGFSGEAFNEFPYARKVARIFNTDHHELLLDAKTYLDAVPETIRFKDAPLAVPFEVSGVLLSKELKKNITVVLAGEGADELFGGYGRIFRSGGDFEKMKLAHRKDFLTTEKRDLLKKNLLTKYKNIKLQSPTSFFLDQYSYISQAQKESIVRKDIIQKTGGILNEAFFNEIFSSIKNISSEEQFMHVFEQVHLLGLLHRLDTDSMAYSVEAREPFVDYRLIEYVSSLPLKYKMRWKSKEDEQKAKLLNSDETSEAHDIPKYLLKEIGREYLPDEIVNRKKLGPPAPLNEWFQGDFKFLAKELLFSADSKSRQLFNIKELEEFVEHIPKDPNSRHGLNVWMLTTFEQWMREYNIIL